MIAFWGVVLLGVCVAFGVLFVMYHMPVRDGQRPGALYSERCGGSFDGLALTPPLVALLLDEENIEIRFLGRTLVIPYAAVRSVWIGRSVLLRGVWIAHALTAVPSEIILFSRSNKRVCSIIEERVRNLRSSSAEIRGTR